MKVSVIVPAYNAEKHIDRCLNSILDQTYKNIEVLVVNDGSTDSTLYKVRQIAAKDDRLFIIDQENSGAYLARRAGENKSKGDYIIHVDADDSLILNGIELLVDKWNNTGADVIIGNYYKILNGKKHLITNRLEIKKGKKELMKGILDNKITGYLCGKLFKRDLMLKIVRTNKAILFEDLYAVLQIFARNELYVEEVESPIYNYLIHSNNSTSTDNRDLIESIYDLNILTQGLLEEEGLLPDLKNEFSAFKCRNWIVYARLGGSRSYDKIFRKEFFKQNFREYARKNLVAYQKMELLVYNYNPDLGHFLTRVLKGVQRILNYN